MSDLAEFAEAQFPQFVIFTVVGGKLGDQGLVLQDEALGDLVDVLDVWPDEGERAQGEFDVGDGFVVFALGFLVTDVAEEGFLQGNQRHRLVAGRHVHIWVWHGHAGGWVWLVVQGCPFRWRDVCFLLGGREVERGGCAIYLRT